MPQLGAAARHPSTATHARGAVEVTATYTASYTYRSTMPKECVRSGVLRVCYTEAQPSSARGGGKGVCHTRSIYLDVTWYLPLPVLQCYPGM